VAEPAVRDEAVRLTTDTRGVLRVVDQLEIGPGRSAGEWLDDATITTKVKSKLAADPGLNPFNIDVDTDDRVVTLSGRVASDTARQNAERLARDTRGVLQVVNELEVGDRANP
jgi:hyperosmotically inducible protein